MPVHDIVVVGHVTKDLIGGEERLGGAAAFAARAASTLGFRAGLVTVAPRDFSLLGELVDDPRIEIARADAPSPTTFELDYSGPVRRVSLRERARALTPADVPPHFREAPVVYLAPVCHECGAELAESFPRAVIAIGLQGWLRRTGARGAVEPWRAPDVDRPPPRTRVVTFSELDHPEAEAIARELAARVPVVALTRGARGATLYEGGVPFEVAASPAREVDPTGAGDVFGLVLTWYVARGRPVPEAAALAAAAAARVVEGPGLGRLESFTCPE